MAISGHRLRVDLITQAALGAAMGELMLGKRLGNRALGWGALIAILPDIDVLLSMPFDTSRQLAFRRGPTHSVWMLVLVSYGLAHFLGRRWVKDKISKAEAGSFALAVLSSHVLLECFTVEGASILWPFSLERVAFNHLFHTDFVFAAPLVVSSIWLGCLRHSIQKKPRGKKQPPLPKRRKICYWGLGLSTGYLALSVAMKFAASAGFDADLNRRNVSYQRRMEAPTRSNILFWRSVVDRGDEFWVGYRTVFERHDTPVRWTVYPKFQRSLTDLSDARELKTVTQISNGWWIARPNATGLWIGDLRHMESRTWGDKKTMVDSRLAYSWVFNSSATGDRLRQIDASSRNASDTFRRMSSRLAGNRESWEANPRLAGVPGALPEFLPAEE